MINPIKDGKLDQDSFQFDASSSFNPRIVNASAVVYKDYWNTQSESNLPYYPEYNSSSSQNWIWPTGDVKYPNDVKVNPYLWNIKGNWRAEKSYAYLTGRNSTQGQYNNSRNEGFFTSFNSFYRLDRSSGIPVWRVNETNWTSASSVTKYSPYGAELENKDALCRYSAAQYGYMYKLPMAVASNSKYQQMGFDGFEEKKTETTKKHFGFANDKLNIVSSQSHTGRNSLKVAKGTSGIMSRNLSPTVETIGEAKCPVAKTYKIEIDPGEFYYNINPNDLANINIWIGSSLTDNATGNAVSANYVRLERFSNSSQQWTICSEITDYKSYVWVRLGPATRANIVNHLYRLIVLDGEAAGTVSEPVLLIQEEPY